MSDIRLRRTIDFRIVFTSMLIVVLCAIFWIDSRYPSLQGKASADPEEALSAPLGFEKHWPEPGAHETVQHIAWTAAEWAITNKQGMTFGLLLAAALLTLMPLLPRVRGNRFAAALQGGIVGTPLGVCINCAAPIGQAMLKGGARVETALGTMFASPSFNVIVLGILFSMFPFYLVALKLAASAAMILLVVPWLSRLAERPGWRAPAVAAPVLPGLKVFQWWQSKLGSAEAGLLDAEAQRPRGIASAFAWVLLRYLRNLWRVIKLALPLMLLAGLIGAVMIELMPWGRIATITQVEGVLPNALMLLLVTVFGVLLPVPMAFDVIVCAVLWDAGLPPQIVASLLVTLGLFSVYPMSLIGTTLSWRLAFATAASVLVLGLIAGGAGAVLDRWHQLRLAQRAETLLATLPMPSPSTPVLPTGRSAAALAELVRPAAAPMQRIGTGEGYELWQQPFEPASAPRGATMFKRLDGHGLGFERLPLPRPYQSMEPGVMHLGGLAAGDVNGDGWQDIAVGSHFGVALYINAGGLFALQQIDFAEAQQWIVGVVALVDLDGDGALDLFFSTWGHGSHILFNRQGSFSKAAHLELPRAAENAVDAAAFADIDRDGDLDLVTGATSYVPRFFYPATSVNRLWRNDGKGAFADEALAGPEGETLTLLFHDFDGDDWPDLFVGNDFDEPDRVYRNQRGQLIPVKATEGRLPSGTNTTMSADAGDLDNDGRAELYLGQIAMGSPGSGMAQRMQQPLQGCAVYTDLADRARCDEIARFQLAVFTGYSTQDLAPCEALGDATSQRDCVVSAYHWNRVLARLPVLGADKPAIVAECARVPADFVSMRDVCTALAASEMDHEKSDEVFPDELPAVRQTNLLYAPGKVQYEDVTNQWKAGLGGWTWNARFGDLDNDGWQDLFITQGTRLRPNSPTAIWYRNQAGKRFEESARGAGLEDHNPTGAALLLDYDNDGDLDLVTAPFLLTPVVWRNDVPEGAAFELALEDRRSANTHALGARITLQAADGRRQVREIKGSGGYESMDAPVARFGLGNDFIVARVEVQWPDGEAQSLPGLALRQGRYRLVREMANTAGK